jgi:hypothetical protein
MVGSSYSVAERRAGVEPARPNLTSAIDAEDPTTELSATGRTAPPFTTFHARGHSDDARGECRIARIAAGCATHPDGPAAGEGAHEGAGRQARSGQEGAGAPGTSWARKKARFEKLNTEAETRRWKIAELITEIYELEKEIDRLEAQIEADGAALEDDDDDALLTKDAKKARAAAHAAVRAKVRKNRKAVAALSKSRRAKHEAIAKAEEKIDTLHRWGSDGFMDLEPHLATALKKARLSWGGEWAGSKDFMHFEVAKK